MKNHNEKEEESSLVKVNEEEKAKKVKGSYFLGLIGGIIGGLIATIPWILMYVYGNMMLSALSIIIAAGVFYGYKLFNGKITKKLPIIIVVESILLVALTTLILIPAFYVHKETGIVSIEAIKTLYANEEFTGAIAKDAMIAVLFTIFGSGAITASIKNKLANGEEDINLSNTEEIAKIKKDSIKKIKPIFEKYNAFEAEHGILKDEIKAELKDDVELKQALNNLKSYGIVKSSKGRLYYSSEAEDKQITAKKKDKSKVVSIIIAVIFVITMIGVVAYNQIENIKPVEVSDGVVNFEIDSSWEEFTDMYNSGWNYYKYINSIAPIGNEVIEEGDYSKYPAYINISYYPIDTSAITKIQDVQDSMKEYITSLESAPEIYEEEITTSKNGYDLLKLKMQFSRTPEQIEYAYYLLKGDTLACVDAYSFNLEDNEALFEIVNNIVDSFKWE